MPPRIEGILETAIYVDDIDRAHAFYGTVLGLSCMFQSERLYAYDLGPSMVLLVCPRLSTKTDIPMPGGLVPGHYSEGPAHFAFRINADSIDAWKQHLAQFDVPVTSEVAWPRGGISLYFEDPDGNVGELASPGVWDNY